MSTDDIKVPLPRSLQEIVGALLFASETPLTAADIRECVRSVAPEEGDNTDVMDVYQSCTAREIDAAIHGLEKELERSGVGFHLVCTGGTYRLQTAPSCGRYVRALLKLDKPSRLSRASLETLAIVAYRQPITKAEVEQIRGVAVDTIMKTLVDLQLVRLVGKSELPGHPFLYGTTPFFLEHFGLSSLGDLNAIDPTLQRADPRARAAAYKKPVQEKTELEQAAEEAAAESSQPGVADVPSAPEDESASDDDVPRGGDIASDDGVLRGGDIASDDTVPRGGVVAADDDDDDFFIDDTPDEFDDDDDDDDDLEAEDEEEE